jgi:hypothetical protein
VTLFHEPERVREHLGTLLTEVLRAPLGAEPRLLPDLVPDADGAASVVSAAVHVEPGDEPGSVVVLRLEAPVSLARELARRMLACLEPTTADVLDAVGELANIAGGGVKALLGTSALGTSALGTSALGTSARLSLPSAALGPRASRRAEETLTVLRAAVDGEVAELTLLRQRAAHPDRPPAVRRLVLEGQR